MINNTNYDQEGCKLSNPNLASRQNSSGFKNPRIVRVSQAFGGKDRHSKVLTVKGLRDRRIRLSVPTAIQLYELQDQLGLSQPSKVIDWLIDVTKDDIDELPPLHMALDDFNPFHLPSNFVPQDFNSTKLSVSSFLNNPNYDYQRTKGKEPIVETNPNTYNYHNFHLAPNLSLSRSDHQLADTYNSCSLAPPPEPRFFSSFPGTTTPSFCSPYFVPNQFQLLSSSSPHMLPSSIVPVPLNLIDPQAKLPFGMNMMSKVNSESNDIG